MKVTVKINPVSNVLKDHGLDRGGDVQCFHTKNVLRRITKYMPYRSGNLIKLTIAQTDIRKPQIITQAPQVRVLYHGKVMVDQQTGAAGFLTENGWRSRKGMPKVVSSRDIVYTKTKNPLAGSYWDRSLVAAEMPVLQRELQRYIDRRG